MARSLTAAVLAELAKQAVSIAYLVEVGISGGFIRVWSGVGSVTFESNTYTGVGALGGISPIEEDTDVRAAGLTFSLDGIDSANLSAALQSIETGNPARAWLAFETSPGVFVADPVKIFEGFTDVPEILLGVPDSRIEIRSESRLIELNKVRASTYNDADQRARFSNDAGFAFVPSLQGKEVLFG